MNRVSVYSGPKTVYEQTGLDGEHCYTFQVAAYIGGRWTKFSPPTRASSLERSVDIEKLDAKISAIEKHIYADAFAAIGGTPCELAGYGNPSNVDGGPRHVEYIAESSQFSTIGKEASILNCQVSECSSQQNSALGIVKPKKGHLLLRLSDGSWKLRFFLIPKDSNLLEFNNPRNEFVKMTVNLLGCRANPLSDKARLLIHKSKAGAAK